MKLSLDALLTEVTLMIYFLYTNGNHGFLK